MFPIPFPPTFSIYIYEFFELHNVYIAAELAKEHIAAWPNPRSKNNNKIQTSEYFSEGEECD